MFCLFVYCIIIVGKTLNRIFILNFIFGMAGKELEFPIKKIAPQGPAFYAVLILFIACILLQMYKSKVIV